MKNAPTITIELSRSEMDYLMNVKFLGQTEVAALSRVEWCSASKPLLKVSPIIAENFRQAFTEQLARVGFDQNYSPTPEGILLEGLIDLFHQP